MRKESGKLVRDLLFRRLGEVAPDFKRSSEYDIKGHTWTFARRVGDLRQALVYQQHKYDDAFTIELAWSCTLDDPFGASFGEPDKALQPRGCRFRLGRFWEPQKDVWWFVVESQYAKGILSALRNAVVPERADLDAAIQREVGDAVARIQQHALPYFERVAREVACA